MHTARYRRRIRIVGAGYGSAESYCYGCHEWYPVTLEFFPNRDSVSRCRACDRERSRLYAARQQFDPAWREKQIRKSAAYRAYLRGEPALAEIDRREQRLQSNLKQTAYRERLEPQRKRPTPRNLRSGWRAA